MQKIKENLSSMLSFEVFLPGLLLVIFNAFTSHRLYHVNTFKLFLLGVMLTSILGYSAFFYKPSSNRSIAAWQWGLLWILPTLGFLPGGWFNPEDSVYFPIELVTDLLLVGWVVLLVRHLHSTKAVQGMLLWIVLVIVMVTIWLAFQGFGRHPFTGELMLYSRPEGSFGNVNYLAGFLAVLTPVMVLLALPLHVQHKWKWSVFNRLCALGAAGLIISALLAYSRAAIAATTLATLGSFVLVGVTSPIKPIKRMTTLVVLIGVGLLLTAIFLPMFIPDILEFYPYRFAQLYDIRAWWGRVVPLRGALDSIAVSPLIGWGLGSSYNLNFSFLPTDADLFLENLSYNHLHNEWLEMGQEGGLLGLLIWGGVMVCFVVALLRFSMRQQNHMLRIFALGVIGGLVAFYAHGIFSVAQRMIVANLPLYTLIGIAGAMLLNEREHKPWFNWLAWAKRTKHLAFAASHLRSWQVVLVGLAVMWLTFYPWIRSFSGMVELNNTGAGINERKDFFAKHPNPYGLSNLLNAQLAAAKLIEARETARMLDTIIPNYRNLPMRLGEVELNLGNLTEAKRLLQKQHQLSTYLPKNNILLAAIALHESDKTVFRHHLEALLMHAIVYYHDDYDYPDQVEFNREGNALALKTLPQKRVAFSLPNAYLDKWLSHANDAFLQQDIQQLSSQEFFLPQFSDIRKRNLLIKMINQLFVDEQQLKKNKEQKRKAYLIANQGIRKSSFSTNADIQRINAEIHEAFDQKRNQAFKEIDKVLASSEKSSSFDSKDLYKRMQVLQKIHQYFGEIVLYSKKIKIKKTTG